MYRRNIEPRVLAAPNDTPVILITGPRQSGKTTLVQKLAGERRIPFLTLDDTATLGLVQRDPQGFVDSLPRSVVIDEVQRVPELFLSLKLSVDTDRRPGRFLLTGSANIFALPRL